MTVAANLELHFERGDDEWIEFTFEDDAEQPLPQAIAGSTFTLHIFGLTGGGVETLAAVVEGAKVRFDIPRTITSRLPTDGKPVAEFKLRRLIDGRIESLAAGPLHGRGRNV